MIPCIMNDLKYDHDLSTKVQHWIQEFLTNYLKIHQRFKVLQPKHKFTESESIYNEWP